jgi:hypothetical protein
MNRREQSSIQTKNLGDKATLEKESKIKKLKAHRFGLMSFI